MRLFLFLLIFLTLYGGLHLYGFLKAKKAFSFGPGIGICLVIFMIVMVLSPITVRILERLGFEFAARSLSYTGYTWMGFLFLFVSASLAIDLYGFFLYVLQPVLRKDFSWITLPSRLSFFVCLVVSLVIITYGYFEAIEIKTERLTIPTAKIPEGLGKLRIVQISDVHLGLIVRQSRLKRILKKVKAAEPDILISTGDLVDGQIDNLSEFADMFLEIHPTYGSFAVTGNHEFYAGLARALFFAKKAGFSMLRGEGLNIAGLLNIAGVDDTAGRAHPLFREVSERELLSKLPSERFTVLLKHRPHVDQDALDLFDLQLSGHTHGGQIFPFTLVTKLYYPAGTGLISLKNNNYLHVSRGSGTWGRQSAFWPHRR
jgi:predicted MPP superfamily phosphohydrolase